MKTITTKNPFTNQNYLLQKSAKFLGALSLKNQIQRDTKGISPHLDHFCRRVRASITVEATLVLPLFMFFFLNLMSIMNIITLHSNMQLALWNAGKQTQLMELILPDTEDSLLLQGVETLGTALLVKQKMVSFLGEEYLASSPLENGKTGLLCFQVPVKHSPILDVRVEYRVKPAFPTPGFPAFSMSNRYYAYPWCGYDLSVNGEKQGEIYYVTENSEIYHLRTSCSYLQLSIQKVVKSEYLEQASKENRNVRACKKCKRKKDTGWIFITKDGDCYHRDISCSALKRTYYSITDTSGHRPCSRCANGAGDA